MRKRYREERAYGKKRPYDHVTPESLGMQRGLCPQDDSHHGGEDPTDHADGVAIALEQVSQANQAQHHAGERQGDSSKQRRPPS